MRVRVRVRVRVKVRVGFSLSSPAQIEISRELIEKAGEEAGG